MENVGNFSQKKKQDLVEIAATFGVLSQEEAKKMSKAELLSFLEKKASGGDTAPSDSKKEVVKERKSRSSAPKAKEEGKKKEILPLEQTLLDLKKKEPKKRAPAKKVTTPTVEKSIEKKEKRKSTPRSNKKETVLGEKEAVQEAADKRVVTEEKKRIQQERPKRKERIIQPAEASSDKVNSPEVTGEKNRQGHPLRSKGRSLTIGPKKTRTIAPSGERTVPSDFSEEKELLAAEPVKEKAPAEVVSGVLEINQDGTYGFLRRENYLQGHNDLFVSTQYIRRYGLRNGDYITGPVREKRETDRYQAIQYINEVNGIPPEKLQRRPYFDRLTAIYPNERFTLEIGQNELSTRIIDLVAPIGKGQRGMIVSPPKAGKTILLQKIANSIHANNPSAKLIVLLIDERPEEVTDMQRSINGEVVYSTFDKTPENHVRIVELVLERAMRLVELGQDVVILLDSITRLARAYNLTINPTGRTLSGGLDPGALYGPKRFFGAARNIENGGSLTIVATALIDTGSRMDEVIFEEFKGTGNMEVYLDRKLSEKRIFPAIDINKSGTRREDLLLSPTELDAVWSIRKAMGQLDTYQVTEMIINLLLKTKSNSQFVQSVNVSFNDKEVFEAMRGLSKPGGNNGNNNGGSNIGYQRQEMR